MLTVLRNRTYSHLFAAQVVSLLGTGLLTVALGLLAVDLGGANAAAILGVAMGIKMVAYVGLAPVITAWVTTLPRTQVLVTADALRAAVALALPIISEAWHIYLLIFLLQGASATFTPTFQATIPDVLPQEEDYTKALSLSRFTYDLEALLSPVAAVALLTVMNYHGLFVGTALGFIASAGLVLKARPPSDQYADAEFYWRKATAGIRHFRINRELTGLMGLNLSVATTSAVVIIGTAPLTLGYLGRSQTDVAILLAASGAGSMAVALLTPHLLVRIADTTVMAIAAVTLPLLLGGYGAVILSTPAQARWALTLVFWATMGAATSAALTPSARVLRRAATPHTQPAIFAAQFSLSHACFLLTYPLTGQLGSTIGLPTSCLSLTPLGLIGAAVCIAYWRPQSPVVLARPAHP